MRAKGKRILVVDDEVPIQRILRRNLTVSGYEVLVADNGKQAVEMARRGVGCALQNPKSRQEKTATTELSSAAKPKRKNKTAADGNTCLT